MSRKRRVAYISGTRADLGLMRPTLELIQASDLLNLLIISTGMHLDPAYGATEHEIHDAGLPISARVEVERGIPSGALMARNIGRMIIGMVEAFEQLHPDLVLLLGDRGEMMAGALAAIHLNLPIAHVHGGELSGTVDEPVRHAISKLSHFHYTATEESRGRLIRMGELPENIFVTGAPGLDSMKELACRDRGSLFAKFGMDESRRLALFLYHPVLEQADRAGDSICATIQSLAEQQVQVLALKPNADAGSDNIASVLEGLAKAGKIQLVTHLPRGEYVSLLRVADMLIGNSSSGIIEAATFGTPVVNIGSRQNLRQRNANVIDVVDHPDDIRNGISLVLSQGRFQGTNVYGDGQARTRIVNSLERLVLGEEVLRKSNAY